MMLETAQKSKLKAEELTDPCPVCGQPTKAVFQFPWIDGGTKTRTVGIACACRQKEAEETEKRFQRQDRIRKVSELRRMSLMDEKVRNASFSRFSVTDENKKLYKIARKYTENFPMMLKKGQGLLLYGDVGSGKSFTAGCIANYLIERMRPVVMTSFIQILEELMRFGDDANMKIQTMMLADLLVIDDLGTERGTDFALEKVYEVIDARYRSGKPIILTTNLDLGYMQRCEDIRYSRIYDRIFEMCYPVKTVCPSWRKKQAVTRFDEMKRMMEA